MSVGVHTIAGRARRFAVAAACGLGVLLPRLATAQDSKAAAEAVFEEGLRAYEAGDFAAACPKLEAAVGLSKRESLGGLLLLAECQEKRGKVATAWAVYREVASKAGRVGQTDRESKAREGEARMAPRLHRVVIRLPADQAQLPGLVLRRGNDVVPSEAFGVSLPTDPGPLVVSATATGHRPFQISVEVPTGPGEVSVDVKLVRSNETAPPLTLGQPGGAPTDETASSDGGGRSGWFYGGLVTAGVGVACMGVSAALAVVAKGDYDDAVGACPEGRCATEADKAPVDDARGLGNVATGVFIGGAVLGALGGAAIIIDLTSSGPPSSTAALRVSPTGLQLAGTY